MATIKNNASAQDTFRLLELQRIVQTRMDEIVQTRMDGAARAVYYGCDFGTFGISFIFRAATTDFSIIEGECVDVTDQAALPAPEDNG
jgi:hypothetical protein